MSNNDAIDERKLILCCAVCCANVSCLPSCGALGCSGKAGLCCLNLQFCCKPGAPLLFPCGFMGIKPECDGFSCCNVQCQACCAVLTAAFPCNKEVPVALTIAGLTLFPKVGLCMQQREIFENEPLMERD